MIKLKFVNIPRDPIWVVGTALSIGHSKSNHIYLDHNDIAEEHATIFANGDAYYLRDLNSEQGTYIGDKRITQAKLNVGDIIRIGEVLIQVIDPAQQYRNHQPPYWALIADSNWLTGQEFTLDFTGHPSLTVGRGSNCDIIFPGTHLSRFHAELFLNEESLSVKDLNSSNGTFVNGDRVSKTTEIFPGDRVSFDVYSFSVFGPAPKALQPTQSPAPQPQSQSPAMKQWKSKPTSPGNREEVNLYTKNYKPLIWATCILMAVVITALIIGQELLSK